MLKWNLQRNSGLKFEVVHVDDSQQDHVIRGQCGIVGPEEQW